MSRLVFRLKDVPLEEAQAIRDMLTQRNIAYYETDAGNWGISLAGIWVKENEDAALARRLIDEYQKQLSNNAGYEHTPTFIESCLLHPLKTLLSIAFLLIVVYFSVKPFFTLGS